MPFTGYRVTSNYGWRTHPIYKDRRFHTGIDLVKSHRAPIGAFTAGKVLYAGYGRSGTGLGGFGNVVVIRDSNNAAHVYAHLDSVAVKVGQNVKKGQTIGRQGATGLATGSHLHYEIRRKYSPSFGWTSNPQNSTHSPTNYLKTTVSLKTSERLNIDGIWGPATTRALQEYLGTIVDGVISGQYKSATTRAILSVSYGPRYTGSMVIRALQKKIGAKQDGFIGPETVRKLQLYLGTPVDGVISRPSSLMVREMQRRLNAGTF